VESEIELALHQAEMQMTGWMCGVKLRDKLSCIELRQHLGIEDIKRWYKEIDCDGMDML